MRENFLAWKTQLIHILNGYGLVHLLNQDLPLPSIVDPSGQLKINHDPQVFSWHAHQQLLSHINTSLLVNFTRTYNELLTTRQNIDKSTATYKLLFLYDLHLKYLFLTQ